MVNILKQIEQTGSTLGKAEIIKNLDEKHQNLLKEIYEDCYGTQMYYIKKQPIIYHRNTKTNRCANALIKQGICWSCLHIWLHMK